jgi:hypothetical protein
MNTPQKPNPPSPPSTCAVGGCGSQGGLCPGVALFVAMLPGLLLVQLTGWEPFLWLSLVVGAPLLMVGPQRLRSGWRALRGRRSGASPASPTSREGGAA